MLTFAKHRTARNQIACVNMLICANKILTWEQDINVCKQDN